MCSIKDPCPFMVLMSPAFNYPMSQSREATSLSAVVQSDDVASKLHNFGNDFIILELVQTQFLASELGKFALASFSVKSLVMRCFACFDS